MFPKSAAFWAAITVSLLAPHAQAASILVQFSATAGFSILPEIPVGTHLTGELHYTTPGVVASTDPGHSTINYSITGAGEGISVFSGGYSFASSSNPMTYSIVGYHSDEAAGGDFFYLGNNFVGGGQTTDLPGKVLTSINFQIAGPPGLLPSIDLPESLDLGFLSLSGYGTAATSVGLVFATGEIVGYTFDSVTIQEVPEPSSGWMSLMILISLALAGFIRSSRTSQRLFAGRSAAA